MPRSTQPVEFNNFVGGLITEASPLTFPPNASLDEENFVLDKDGSRDRRRGMDLEAGYQIVDTGQVVQPGADLVYGSYKWSNVGGDPSKTLIVVQVQNKVMFFDADHQPVSGALVASWTYPDDSPVVKFSFASVDGKLVVVTGRKDIDVFSFGLNNDFTVLSKRLLIRDLFGVTDMTVS